MARMRKTKVIAVDGPLLSQHLYDIEDMVGNISTCTKIMSTNLVKLSTLHTKQMAEESLLLYYRLMLELIEESIIPQTCILRQWWVPMYLDLHNMSKVLADNLLDIIVRRPYYYFTKKPSNTLKKLAEQGYIKIVSDSSEVEV